MRGREERGRQTGRIKSIDINAQVDGTLCPNPLTDLLDNAISPDIVDLARLHDLETTVSVVVIVTEPGQGGPNPRVDVAVIGQQALLVRVVEVGPVVDGRLLGRCAAEYFGPPRVEVAVEVHDRDGAVGGGHAPQQGEGDGVVATQGDDSRQGFAMFGRTGEVSAGGGRTG